MNFENAGLQDSIDQIDQCFKAIINASTMADLFHRGSALYHDRSTREADHLRGCLFSKCRPLPREAVQYLVEELEFGTNPYTLAAAADSARDVGILPFGIDRIAFRAIQRIRRNDAIVTLYTATGEPRKTTPVTELLLLLRRIAGAGIDIESTIESIGLELAQEQREILQGRGL